MFSTESEWFVKGWQIIVTCLLKAGIAEPYETAVARQWPSKHISAATESDATVEELLEKKHATIDELFEAVLYMRSAPMLYTEDRKGTAVSKIKLSLCLTN
jgi:hypothetical protein